MMNKEVVTCSPVRTAIGRYRGTLEDIPATTCSTETPGPLSILAKKKTRAASIARTLKRSEGATRQKAFTLGLSMDSRA
jgi:hypothetical protein